MKVNVICPECGKTRCCTKSNVAKAKSMLCKPCSDKNKLANVNNDKRYDALAESFILNMNASEIEVYEWLKVYCQRNGLELQAQVIFHGNRRPIYIIDFVVDGKFAIEVNGYRHTMKQAARDECFLHDWQYASFFVDADKMNLLELSYALDEYLDAKDANEEVWS